MGALRKEEKMIKKRENGDKEEKQILHHNEKKLYEKPEVKEYGSVEKLTQGAGGTKHDSGTSYTRL
jgi:hypothetical protein